RSRRPGGDGGPAARLHRGWVHREHRVRATRGRAGEGRRDRRRARPPRGRRPARLDVAPRGFQKHATARCSYGGRMAVTVTPWGAFAAVESELAAFVAERLRAAPSYLATVRASGAPRVHPVTPIFTTDGLYLFMEPTSPKATDLRERGRFALHNGVPDNAGTGGEASVTGPAHPVEDAAERATVAAAPGYPPPDPPAPV